MLLTWYFNSSEERKAEENGDIELTTEILEEFKASLKALDVRLDFYSGSWDALHEAGAFESSECKGSIVLTSETIYSMDSLPGLVESLERACGKSIEDDLGRATLKETGQETLKGPELDVCCLVAAKVLYFGVGGGVNAFKEELTKRNAISKTVWSSDRGVGRVVLEVHFA